MWMTLIEKKKKMKGYLDSQSHGIRYLVWDRAGQEREIKDQKTEFECMYARSIQYDV